MGRYEEAEEQLGEDKQLAEDEKEMGEQEAKEEGMCENTQKTLAVPSKENSTKLPASGSKKVGTVRKPQMRKRSRSTAITSAPVSKKSTHRASRRKQSMSGMLYMMSEHACSQ